MYIYKAHTLAETSLKRNESTVIHRSLNSGSDKPK